MIRRGAFDDAPLLVAMHERCSAETVARRYHAPMPLLRPRLARTLLEPLHGFSVVAISGDHLIGIATVARDGTDRHDFGLLVEDRWQHRGIGATLLRAVAAQATALGLTTLHCVSQPGNEAALATVRRAGLTARVTMADALVHGTIPLPHMAEPP